MKLVKTILLSSLSVLSFSFVKAQQAFDKQGHRGGRGLMPENTLSSMKKAVDLGVTLEMDISFTKEKLPVVSHDQYINPAFSLKPNGDSITKQEATSLRMYDMPYSDIRGYDVGSKFYPLFPQQQKIKEHIPVLAELIDSVEAYAKQKGAKPPHYNIETKLRPESDNTEHPAPQEFVDLLMAVLVKKNVLARTIIQSFDPRTLEIIHKQYPKVPTAFLVVNKKSLKENLSSLSFKPTIYSPDFKMLNKQVVDDCHALGIKVLPWTVNKPEDIASVKALGVDGIISDYPDRL
ncbi:glycerophosphodiester phosphodiesterase [Mucilaginibacter conchicola]|uniref:Glycerophosphodiester phosphodiesterase n=1 Tax=Mucilaginibacter conchicola TaxID=2303333 RepID=A0A372NU09_9SPHI|nr:glycerophosphodiester phosphodiesterase family protein [Mucilaginibacter conchicola]RFZ92748.1 glycerophosphodiester phosphodiesterase [Mucilaginibacter conchicola]